MESEAYRNNWLAFLIAAVAVVISFVVSLPRFTKLAASSAVTINKIPESVLAPLCAAKTASKTANPRPALFIGCGIFD